MDCVSGALLIASRRFDELRARQGAAAFGIKALKFIWILEFIPASAVSAKKADSSGCACTSKPATRAVPEVGLSSPVRILIVVVLPAAFGPSTTKNSPRFTVRLRSFTATTSPKRFTMWISSIMACPLAQAGQRLV